MDKHLANIGSAKPNSAVDAEIRRLTRRSFTWAPFRRWPVQRASGGWPRGRETTASRGRCGESWNSMNRLPKRYSALVGWPQSFLPSSAVEPRVNGHVGLMSPAQLADWTVHVTGKVDRQIPLSAIKALPAYEMTTQLKCVEGWDSIVSWKGVRLADFLSKFGVPSEYIGLSTPPDGQTPAGQPDRFYVGFDRPSALHPQTLLCYEMNGAPLTQGHGAPLRLVSTVKYGYKCIKRIGVIELTEQRPADYWAQSGYDWYGGH